jgi:hypothetical protein
VSHDEEGSKVVEQIRVQWSTLPSDATTWEDFEVLKRRFTLAPI